MIKKIDACKIEYKPNVFVFIWYCNDFIKMKSKWFLKINLKSSEYWRIKSWKERQNWKKRKKEMISVPQVLY